MFPLAALNVLLFMVSAIPLTCIVHICGFDCCMLLVNFLYLVFLDLPIVSFAFLLLTKNLRCFSLEDVLIVSSFQHVGFTSFILS